MPDNALSNIELAAAGIEELPPQLSLADKAARILAGKELEPPAGAPVEEPAPVQSDSAPEKAPPLTLASAAERLGIEPAELYALKIRTAEGDEIALSELKDRFKDASEAARVREETRKLKAESEADRMRQERELNAILNSIEPGTVKPELRAAYDARQRDYQSREREALLRTVPDWADPVILTADKSLMADAISEYGFSAADLEGVTDHRLLRLVRDFAKARAKAKAEEKAPPTRVAAAPRKAGSQTEAQRHGQLKAAVTKGQMTRGAAAQEILKGFVK